MTKFKDVAHFYLGCKCKWRSLGDDEWKESSIDLKTLDRIYDNQPFEIKPILRPLSDLTEEEDVKVANFCFGSEDFIVTGRGMGYEENGHEIHESVKCIKMEVFCDHPMIKSFLPAALLQIDNEDDLNPIIIGKFSDAGKELEDDVIEQPFQLTAYLLSKHFDIFGLIKSGEALDKTKL